MSLFSKIGQFLGYSDTPALVATLPVQIRQPSTESVRQPTVPFRQLMKMRRYDAAVPSITSADWTGNATTANYEIYNGARKTRYLARDLARNNPYVEAFLRELCNNVVGQNGFKLQSRVKNLRGNALNARLNGLVQDSWCEFNTLGAFDVTGLYSGLTADELIMRTLATDGEVLIRLIRGYGSKYRLAVQLIECDSLDIHYNASLPNNVTVVMGIESDSFGRPIAYHLCRPPMMDTFAANRTPGQRTRVPADELIHLFLPRRIGQNRGMSWFSNVMTKLRHLERTDEYMVIANRSAAAKMGFLTRSAEAGTRYKGQGELPTGEIVEELSAGEIIELPTGYDFKGFDPGTPNETFSAFRKCMLRTVSAGLGAMYPTIGQDMESVNYSSARFSKDDEIFTWQSLQRFYIEHFKQPLFNAFAEMAILSGSWPDISFEQVPSIQNGALFRPRGYTYVDPLTDVQASCMAIDAGLSTRRLELAQLGLTPEEVFAELADEAKLAQQYGLEFTTPLSKGAAILTRPNGFDGPPPAQPAVPQQARK